MADTTWSVLVRCIYNVVYTTLYSICSPVVQPSKFLFAMDSFIVKYVRVNHRTVYLLNRIERWNRSIHHPFVTSVMNGPWSAISIFNCLSLSQPKRMSLFDIDILWESEAEKVLTQMAVIPKLLQSKPELSVSFFGGDPLESWDPNGTSKSFGTQSETILCKCVFSAKVYYLQHSRTPRPR